LALVWTELGHWGRGSLGKTWAASGLVAARNRSAAQAGLGWAEHRRRTAVRQRFRARPGASGALHRQRAHL